MKKFEIILFLLISSCTFSFGQNENRNDLNDLLSKILKIYELNIIEHIQTLVDQEFPDNSDKELVRSRFNYLKSKTLIISHDVRVSLAEGSLENPDKNYISRIIDSHYKATYTGLPPSFFASVHKEIEKI